MTRSPLQPSAGACLVGGLLLMVSALLGSYLMAFHVVSAILIVLCVVFAVASIRREGQAEPESPWTSVLVVVGAAYLGLVSVAANGLTAKEIALILMLVLSAVGLVVPSSPILRRVCGLALPLAAAVLLMMSVSSHPTDTDVTVFLSEGSTALARGLNPYAITYTNIYGPFQAELAYGDGVVQDGRIVYGFPYPPLVLFLSVPGLLMGDPRFTGVAIVCAVTAVLIAMSRTHGQRGAAALLLCAPGLVNVVTPGWVEPIVVALLGLSLALVQRRNFAVAAVVVGLLFASKQYFIVLAPCLWLLRPYATPRRIALMVGSAAVTTIPALLWNPPAFWRSVVEWQFIQPLRPDSISLYVAAVEVFSWPTSSLAGIAGLVAGFLVGGVLAICLRPGPASFSFAIGIALTVTVVLSKQAFLNYYYLCGSALLITAWSVAHGEPGPRSVDVDVDVPTLEPRPR